MTTGPLIITAGALVVGGICGGHSPVGQRIAIAALCLSGLLLLVLYRALESTTSPDPNIGAGLAVLALWLIVGASVGCLVRERLGRGRR